jgi:integrase
MPVTKRNALIAAQIPNLPPGEHTDGQGLVLRVSDNGRRHWVLRTRFNGKAKNLGLGGFLGTTLKQARKDAEAARKMIGDGFDPVSRRPEIEEANRVPTFIEAALRYIELNRPSWRNAKHAGQWESTLKTYAYPAIGDKPVDQITSNDVMQLLEAIWNEKRETAGRVRQRLSAIFAYSMARGWCTSDPASPSILKVLPRAKPAVNHHPALAYTDVPKVLRQVEMSTSYPATKLAFRLLALTACRSGEIRGMTWDEVDWGAAIWTIPMQRTKTAREHRVPLSSAATKVLQEAWGYSSGEQDALVFTAPRSGGQLSDMTLLAVLRRLGIPAVPHGLRSSFRNWAAEQGADWAVAEASLGHSVGSTVEQAYMRSDLLEARRGLMEQWGRFCAGQP